jgi:DNA polymerase I
MKKLVLIDGHSIAFRAFYGLPLLSNASGMYTNAVYGFTMMLLKLLEEERPTHMLVAFDAGKITFRHQEFAEYKGSRQKAPSELHEQFPLLEELLDRFGIKYFQLENYEADDVIGTLAHSEEVRDMEVLIVSGDKDLLQLVNEHVSLLFTRKGVTETERYGVQEIEEKYGLTPKQIIDLKGLMGDASDNIPGIPGVGEKTALKMLQQYPSVEEVLRHIDQLPGRKLQEKVRENQEQARLSKRLATIFTAVPVGFPMQDLALAPIDSQQVEEFFQKLSFKTLLQRIPGKKQTAMDATVSAAEKGCDIVTLAHLEQAETLLQAESLALFVEITEANPHHADMIGLALSDGEKQVYIPLEVAQAWPALAHWLADSRKQKIVYDMKKIEIVLRNQGWEVNGFSFDLLLAAYLLNPSQLSFAFSELVRNYLRQPFPTDEEVYGKGVKRRSLAEKELAQHLACKLSALYQLYPVLLQELQRLQLDSLLFELEMPLARILAQMERQGVRIDQERLHVLGLALKESMERLTTEIYELAGSEFNLNSPKQLAEILFDKLGLPVVKKTKTGYSTSADVLEKLAPQHEVVDKILHFRQVGKLYSTYVQGLQKEIAADGKIHTQFHQTITATGRLSSAEPNLQNIPIRLEEGRRIRQVFVPAQADWLLLAADYSQVELRVLAHLAADENLQAAFKQDLDIHTKTAMDVFAVEEDQVTSLMRRQAKAVNFGIIYGISDFGLAQNLQITRKQAQEFIDRYFATYPRVRSYMEQVIEQARQAGYVTTLFHRRRYLPEIDSSQFHLRSFAERTAMNTPIQGTAADIIKFAMIQLDRRMKEAKLKSHMLLQVHDELIFEVPAEELSVMKALVIEVMEQPVPLPVPLHVEVGIGKSWYEAK